MVELSPVQGSSPSLLMNSTDRIFYPHYVLHIKYERSNPLAGTFMSLACVHNSINVVDFLVN